MRGRGVRSFYKLVFTVLDKIIRSLKKLRLDILVHSLDGKCAYCGDTISVKDNTASLDHVHPVSKGGDTSFENALPACTRCNRLKADYSTKSFRIRFHKNPCGKFYFETGIPVEIMEYPRWEYDIHRSNSKSGYKKRGAGFTPYSVRENLVRAGLIKA